jgi:HNH endonuclease/AP2 domain
MHRFLLGVTDRNIFVDHIDGDGLNNQRANLRLCTAAQNAWNRKKPSRAGQSKATSAFKGVSWYQPRPRWSAHIKVGGRDRTIGYYDTEKEAAAAYNREAIKHFGAFAYLNDLDAGVSKRTAARPVLKGKRQEES